MSGLQSGTEVPAGGQASEEAPPPRKRERLLARLGRLLGLGAAGIGLSGIAGWAFDVPALVQPFEGALDLQPSSAACFVVAGLALAATASLRDRGARHIRLAAGSFLATFAALRGVEATFGIDLGLATAGMDLARDWGIPQPAPLAVACCLILFAAALALTQSGRREIRRYGNWSATISLLLSGTAVLEHLYGLGSPPADRIVRGMSFYSATALVALSGGLLALDAAENWIGRLLGDSIGSMAARQVALCLLPGVLAVGAGVAWLADSAGLTHAQTLSALVILLLMLVVGTKFRMADLLDKVDDDRRSQSRALAFTERRHDLAQEVAMAGTWEWNLLDGRLTWSQSLRKLYGLPSDAPADADLLRGMLHPDDRGRDECVPFRRAGPGERVETEFRIVRPDGDVRWVSGVGQAFDIEGESRMLGLHIDVTDRRRREEELTTARRAADRAALARSKFIATAGHDLRQPVQSLLLYMDVLRARVRDGWPPGAEAADVVQGMDAATRSLRDLLNAMLEVSSLDAGLIHARREPVPLGDMMARVAVALGADADRRGLRLRVVRTALWADTDPSMLERVLRVALTNALRFTMRGGIVIGCRRRGGEVVLEVADTGIGMPPEELETVFDPFHQVDKAGREPGDGLGLGLTIARKMADLLGHRAWLTSRPGRGTVFHLAMPAAPPRKPPPQASAGAAPRAGKGGYTVAVVEDDDTVRGGLRAMLTAWGHTVIDGRTADDVLDDLQGLIPDAIIADYRLPAGMNGLQALRAIRIYCKWPIPGIILTGADAVGRLPDVERSGEPVVVKPVTAETLRNVLAASVASTPWTT